jgi:hypothetical protein
MFPFIGGLNGDGFFGEEYRDDWESEEWSGNRVSRRSNQTFYNHNEPRPVTCRICGFENLIITENYDMILTSPPYFDLEKYSEDALSYISMMSFKNCFGLDILTGRLLASINIKSADLSHIVFTKLIKSGVILKVAPSM